MFDVNIRTEYQQQMNDILPSFVLSTKADVIEYNGHRYELFIGQQPSAFDGVDIGQYLNFDSPSEEVEEGNKEVVDQIISIIKKKK